MMLPYRLAAILLLPLVAGCISYSTTSDVKTGYSSTRTDFAHFSFAASKGASPQAQAQKLEEDMAEAQNYPSQKFAWNGQDKIEVEAPAILCFQPSDTPYLEIRAPAKLLKATQVTNGHVRLLNTAYKTSGKIPYTIIVHAPQVPRLHMSAFSHVVLENIDQKELDIEMSHLGSLRATGEVQKLKLKLSGKIIADLTRLTAQDINAEAHETATLHMRGNGVVNLVIADLAEVSLYTRPIILKTQVQSSSKFYAQY